MIRGPHVAMGRIADGRLVPLVDAEGWQQALRVACELARERAVPIADAHAKRTLVLGVGNVLYGDDGFGPAVARLIE